MKLGTLLEGVSVSKLFQTMFGQMVTTHDVEVGHLHYDSRKIGRGDAFVAISGSTTDGHAFIQQALAQGAKVVVIERDDAISDPQCMHTGVVKIVVSSTRKALARMAANFYGRPADTMKIVGITGTNGKTTTTHIVRSILEAGGERAGLIGTIENRFGAIVEEATHTTPESLELHALFARMREEHCTAVSMEVSSHALDQSRVAGIAFACGVFTNLTQDHLDYHGTMEKYFAAKKALFEGLSPGAKAVINVDDQWGRHLAQDTKVHAVTYGAAPDSTVRLLDASLSVDGSILKIDVGGMTTTVTTPLPGRFHVSNGLRSAFPCRRSIWASPLPTACEAGSSAFVRPAGGPPSSTMHTLRTRWKSVSLRSKTFCRRNSAGRSLPSLAQAGTGTAQSAQRWARSSAA